MISYRQRPEYRTVLRIFQLSAVMGLLISLVMLARNSAPNAELRHVLYTTWFAITIVSIEAILHWLKVGVYALGLATATVTLVELLEGVATLGGASLGFLVAFILITYLHPIWNQFE